MKLYVVKTCDGDVYYQANRNYYKLKATEMAADQVLNHDLSRYDETDRQAIGTARQARDWDKLYTLLVKCRAIREDETRE